jgi:hypothetical protein
MFVPFWDKVMFGLGLADIPNIRYLLTFPANGHALAVSLFLLGCSLPKETEIVTPSFFCPGKLKGLY